MTTVPAPRPAPTPAAARPAGSAAASSVPALDPVKVLKKYAWFLAGAFVFGGLLGVAAFFVLRQVHPVWQATAFFEGLAIQTDPGAVETERPSEDELERFVATQVLILQSDELLSSVVNDQRLMSEAPKWAQQYTNSSGAIDSREALQDLKDVVRVRIETGTNVYQLSTRWQERADTLGLCTLIRDAYMRRVQENARARYAVNIDLLRRQINKNDAELADWSQRQERLIREANLDTLDSRSSAAALKLKEINSFLTETRSLIVSTQESLARMETMLNSETGITFTDTQRAEVELNPQVAALKAQIQELTTTLSTMKRTGIGVNHREYRQIVNRIEAAEAELAATRERELLSRFNAEVDSARLAIRQLQAQEADYQQQAEELGAELTDLTQKLAEYEETKNRIRQLQESREERSLALENLESLSNSPNARRVRIIQDARPGDALAFPQLTTTTLAGIVLLVGLVGGIAVAIELLDQRVKGPSDVAMIPRTRVLGIIPLATEDPTNPKNFETIFRDEPKGVLAESVRQIRTTVIKRMEKANHKTLLLVSGLPGSGTTAITTNLATAAASINKRVLLIDANYRRPGVHKNLGVPEQPGLADVLSGQAAFAAAVQQSGVANLDVIAAGTKDKRVVEHLSTTPMSELLAAARAEYDLVLIDVAPAVVSGDAIALSNLCDASVLVVKAFAEKRGMVARLKSELSESKSEMLGVIVNGVRSAAGGYMRRNIRTSHQYQATAAPSLPTT